MNPAAAEVPAPVRRDHVGIGVGDPVSLGRVRARWHRRAFQTAFAGIAGKALAAAVRLATIPLALQLLGVDRYGLWLTVGSLVTWLGIVGPGLGYGLINAVSEATAVDDWPRVRRHVSTAALVMGLVGILVCAVAPTLRYWPLLTDLVGAFGRPELADDAVALIGIAGVVFGLSLATEFIVPVCAGLQEGYLASVAAAAGGLGSAALLLLFASVGQVSLTTFALVMGLPPVLANAALSGYVFGWRHAHIRPTWRLFDVTSLRALMGFGGWMFLVQLGDLAIFQSANILIASHFGAGAVPRYAVPAMIFSSITAVCFLIVQPYWPALREAVVHGDWEFIRAASFRTLRLRLAISGVSAVIIVAMVPVAIRHWAGGAAVPSHGLLWAMALYYFLVTLSGNYVVLLLSFGLVRTKALLTLLVAGVQIGGFLLLAPVAGTVAIPLAGSVGVLLDCLLSARAAAVYARGRRTT